jgi:hypothetical protein
MVTPSDPQVRTAAQLLLQGHAAFKAPSEPREVRVSAESDPLEFNAWRRALAPGRQALSNMNEFRKPGREPSKGFATGPPPRKWSERLSRVIPVN